MYTNQGPVYLLFTVALAVRFGCTRAMLGVRCSRNMTCDPSMCRPVPVLSDEFIGNAFAGHVIQFWGDSITTQFECDARNTLQRTAKSSESVECHVDHRDPSLPRVCPEYPGATTFTHKNGIHTTVMSYRVGCPWFCIKGDNAEIATAPELANLVNNRFWNTSVVVFNLGAHYTVESLNATINLLYRAALSSVSVKHIVIRSPNSVHFNTASGSYNPTEIQPECKANMHIVNAAEIQKDAILRQLAQDLHHDPNVSARVIYLDVMGITDFPTMHPQWHTTAGKRTRKPHDCLHICQTCDLLASANSLLASMLYDSENVAPSSALAAKPGTTAKLL